jgi:hypothetical protein
MGPRTDGLYAHAVNFGELLGRKMAGMPVALWLGLAAAIAFVFFRAKGASPNASSAGDQSSDGSATTPGTPADSADTTQAAASGISDADLAALLGPQSPLQQILSQLYGGGSQAPSSDQSSTATASGAGGETTSPDEIGPATQTSASGGAVTTNPITGAAINPISGLGPGAVLAGGGYTGSAPESSGSIGTAASSSPPAPLHHGPVLSG